MMGAGGFHSQPIPGARLLQGIQRIGGVEVTEIRYGHKVIERMRGDALQPDGK